MLAVFKPFGLSGQHNPYQNSGGNGCSGRAQSAFGESERGAFHGSCMGLYFSGLPFAFVFYGRVLFENICRGGDCLKKHTDYFGSLQKQSLLLIRIFEDGKNRGRCALPYADFEREREEYFEALLKDFIPPIDREALYEVCVCLQREALLIKSAAASKAGEKFFSNDAEKLLHTQHEIILLLSSFHRPERLFRRMRDLRALLSNSSASVSLSLIDASLELLAETEIIILSNH